MTYHITENSYTYSATKPLRHEEKTYQFSLPQSTLRAQSFNYYFLEIFLKSLISAFSANSAVNYYEKTDINKTIHRWPGFLNTINTPHIEQAHQCNNSIIFVA